MTWTNRALVSFLSLRPLVASGSRKVENVPRSTHPRHFGSEKQWQWHHHDRLHAQEVEFDLEYATFTLDKDPLVCSEVRGGRELVEKLFWRQKTPSDFWE